MGNHTGPPQRGPDDQMHRTDQPTADRPAQTARGPTSIPDGCSGQGESDRHYVCLDCQSVVTDFPTECPHCGGRAFRTTATRRPPLTLREQFLRVLTRVTAPLNPYVPR